MIFLKAVCAAFLISSLLHAQSDADALLREALALAKAQRWTDAALTLREGQSRFPKDSRFPMELAGLAYRQKHESTAKKELERALRLAPNDDYANDFLGTLYFDDGNLGAALGPWNRIAKPVVGQIVFAPVPKVNQLLRERAVPLAPGQLLTRNRLLTIRDNLERLSVVADVNIELVPHPKQDDKYDLLIRSLPLAGPFSGWLGHLLPLLRELPYQAADADFLNLGRQAVNVRTQWRWDPNKRRIVAKLEAPWRSNPRIQQEYSFDLRDETWSIPGVASSLLLRAGTVTGGFAFSLRPDLHWTAAVRLEDRTYAHAPPQAAFRNGMSEAIDNRLTSDWLVPRARLSGSQFASLSTGRFAGNRLIAARAGASARWLPGAREEKYQITAQTQAGQVFGPAPLDQQFALAMERDTEDDLWLRGIVGTRNGQKGHGPIGKSYFLEQTDVQRRLFELPFVQVSAGPFFDGGTVGHALSSPQFRGFQYNTGLEVKVRTASAVDVFLIYGRDLANGGGSFYTAVRRNLR